MKHKYLILPIYSCMSLLALGQTTETITLNDCYSLAKLNYPTFKQFELNIHTRELESEILDATFLPEVTAYGKASYQSDAIQMFSSFPGAPGIEVDKFQYNMGINLEQKVYDGGINKIKKNIKNLETEIRNTETETAINKLYELVNSYFFGIQTLLKNTEILNLKIDVLSKQQTIIKSGFENDMLTASDLYRIEAEILSTSQQIDQLDIAEKKLESGLKILIGKIDVNINWEIPESIYISDSIARPENRLFEINRQIFSQKQKLQSRTFLPQFSAYGQAGYSYPGLNMFENQPDGYYVVGGKMGWKLFDWNKTGKNNQIIEIKKEEIDIKEEDFRRNLDIQIQNLDYEIILINELLIKDDEIISKKQLITKSSESALKNGTITTAEYINDFNAELKARFDFELHKISLLETKAQLAILKGTIN